MIAMSKIILESRGFNFRMNLAKTNFRLLQPYKFPIITSITVICGPYFQFFAIISGPGR